MFVFRWTPLKQLIVSFASLVSFMSFMSVLSTARPPPIATEGKSCMRVERRRTDIENCKIVL